MVGLLDGNVSRVLARMRQVGADITSSSTSSVMWRMVDQLVMKNILPCKCTRLSCFNLSFPSC